MLDLKRHINFIINAHNSKAKTAQKSLRLWDKKTPYSIHPIWCSMTILTESSLAKQLREDGCLTLLYHDILEDTNAKLPSTLSIKVKSLIREMTFTKGITQEMREIWKKEPEVRLLKLYDKVSNLLDASWMSTKQLGNYNLYTQKLTQNIETYYGILNIVKIARSLK